MKRDGVVLGEAAWGTPAPVDPGPHVVEATAPGRRAWTTTVDVRSAPQTEVVVPVLDAAPSDGGGAKALLTQRNVGIGVAGLGVVAAVAGAVFGLGAISTNDSAKSHCRDGNLCDPTGLDELDSARSKATASTIFFLLGAAAIGGGAYLFFTAPNDGGRGAEGTPTAKRKPKRAPAMALAPAVGVSSGGLAWSGTW